MSKKKKTITPLLIVERNKGNFWGRVEISDNLIVDTASSLESLKKKMRKLISDFEDKEAVDFDISYDLTAFFEQYAYINISKIASKSGINYSLMRQYSIGYKYPSEIRVKMIEKAIREIGKELIKVKLHKAEK
jgi:hypothetical protein